MPCGVVVALELECALVCMCCLGEARLHVVERAKHRQDAEVARLPPCRLIQETVSLIGALLLDGKRPEVHQRVGALVVGVDVLLLVHHQRMPEQRLRLFPPA